MLGLVLSGDGNWAPLIANVSRTLADSGIAVIGLEARDYLSHGRTPEETARDMERVCSLCETTTVCRHELASGTAGVSYPYFCPNAEELKALSKKARRRG